MNIPTTLLRFFHLSLFVSVFAVVGTYAQLSLSLDVDQPSCNGFTDGKIQVTPSGGDAPYDYSWSDGNDDQRRFSLSSGTYTVTVTDDAGATASETVVLTNPEEISATFVINGDICNSTSASYDILPSGGTPPYVIRLDGDVVSGRVSNLDAGFHYAEITDANGCKGGEGIKTYDALTVNVRTQNVECFGFCDGTVEAQVQGGNGPYTFLWSSGQTDQLVYNLDPGTYTVTVTDENGCTAMASGTLVEPDPITFDVSLQDSCAGATRAFVTNIQGGTGTKTVRFSTGNIGDSAYLTEGQHYVVVEDDNGCETTQRIIVSDGIQSVTTMNVDATCDDPGRSLLCITGGKGPFTYLWSDGQTTIEAVNLPVGVYSYTIIDGGGCRFDGSTVIDGPTPAECNMCDADAGTLTGGTTTDEDCTDVTLTATVANTPTVPAGFQILYVLTSNGVIQQVGPNPSFVIAMGGAGTYTIHTLVYDPNTLDLSTVVLGTTRAADIFLQLIDGGGTICASLDLTGTTFVVPTCSTPEPVGCTDGAASGSLAGTDVCFDGTSTSLAAMQVTPPVVPAGYAQIFLLTSSPGDTILATSSSPEFMISAEGSYQIRSFVYNVDSFDISAIILPGQTTITQLSSILTTCASLGNGAAQFDVTLFDPLFPEALTDQPCPDEAVMLNPGGNAAFTYLWSPANLLDDPTAVSPMANVNSNTTFIVEISEVVSGQTCTVTRTYDVTVSALPTLSGPADITTCAGGDVDLQVSNVNGSSIMWSTDPDFNQVLSTDSIFTVTSGAATTYFVRATNSNGCTVTDQVSVGDFPIDVELEDDFTICPGAPAQFGAEIVSGDATSYGLFDSQGNLVETSTTGMFDFSPSANDMYQVVASNTQGCTDTASINIDVSTVDATLLTSGMTGDTAIFPGNPVDLVASTNSNGMFVFDEDETFVNVNNEQATVMPDSTTNYTVTVTDEFGCEATASIVVTILEFECDEPFLFVPNAFSPDGDGVNDVFFIDGVNVDEAYYMIVNRWGEMVYESFEIGDENGNGWDGTFNGQLVDPDVYGLFVRIRCNDGGNFFRQGNVTVIR